MGRPKKADKDKAPATRVAEQRRKTKREEKLNRIKTREWYLLNSILGFWWAIFYFLLSVGVKLVSLMPLLISFVDSGVNMVDLLSG